MAALNDATLKPYRGWLPREGFHADTLAAIISSTVLNPILTLPAILALQYTARGESIAQRSPRLLPIITALTVYGALRKASSWLSERAMNNFVSDSTYDWRREVVVVTGGADGIGKRIALMLAARGVRVAVLDVQTPTYELPENVSFHHCDITSTSAILTAKLAIEHAAGEPTVLVNNAGVCRGKPLLETSEADVALTFNVNTLSHYKLMRAFAPSMVANNHGMIVSVTSAAAYVTAPRMTEYAASKAAAMSFHEGFSAEMAQLAPRVRSVLVNQGYTRTALFQGFAEGGFVAPPLHVDTVAQAIVDQIMSGRSGQLVLPEANWWVAVPFRGMPNWMQYGARKGMGNLMQNWSGRQVNAEK